MGVHTLHRKETRGIDWRGHPCLPSLYRSSLVLGRRQIEAVDRKQQQRIAKAGRAEQPLPGYLGRTRDAVVRCINTERLLSSKGELTQATSEERLKKVRAEDYPLCQVIRRGSARRPHVITGSGHQKLS